ncbi:MAG: hypothetical protein EZS28_009539 [Streblomastix strix]|uniref:Uncharacterized protein n=1 Tax=Streblomastix strix TaxID=222440 RepID=A0A5J4WJJ8_9EUKA|nr:MAG: hypothetical protein EZS28_009539 [Streblomastix strix]
MNQASALKDLMEHGTSIEYFDRGYITKVKDKIKVYEEGKKSAQTLTQAQQTRLLLEARGGGKSKTKKQPKYNVENDEDADDEQTSLNERKYSLERQRSQYPQEQQLMEDLDEEEQLIVEKPFKTPRPNPMKKVIKQPQITYNSPQVDLQELLRLRTENSFIKQQHQDSIKQVEKYKAKIKDYKLKRINEELQEKPQTPSQEQVPEPQQEQQQELRFKEIDLW